MEFTWDRAADEYLLNCSDEAGQYLLRLNPKTASTYNLGRISDHQGHIRKATWSGNGSSYVSLANDAAGSAFCLKTGDMLAPITILWHGGVRSCTLNGDHLFFSGNPDDQAPGIWDYDLKSSTFKCIVSSTSGPLKNSIGTTFSCEVMTNSLGEQRYYHLWPPAHVLPGQKYPVLLAQELDTWFPCFQIAAQNGCYVAVVDRPFFNTWDGEPEHSWIEDVSRLYEVTAQNPNVDTNRVYLYACSRETFFLSQLMNNRPSLAAGAILFSPTVLPDVSNLQNSHILLVDGKADGDAAKRLPEFQDRAAAKGNDITLFLQDAAGHVTASGITEHNREIQFAKFMSDNR
jgi:dipeptidyl aminopeptidase/acylaminoacyl peptidase